MDSIDYREKLGIGFSDIDKQKIFIKRIQILFLNKFSIDFNNEDEINFCYELGIQTWAENQTKIGGHPIAFDEPMGMRKLFYHLSQFKDDFIQYLVGLIAFVNIYPYESEIQNSLIKNIELVLKDSHIEYELKKDSEKIFIFPKGAKELDKALVSDTLDWLGDYPKTQIAFTNALKLYSEATELNASTIADNFRKTLETFFQEFFEMPQVTLEKVLDRGIYGKYLEAHNVPKELRNDLFSLINSYKNFMNNYAKHHDKTAINILEYIMYQTGNIIRLLITLSKKDN